MYCMTCDGWRWSRAQHVVSKWSNLSGSRSRRGPKRIRKMMSKCNRAKCLTRCLQAAQVLLVLVCLGLTLVALSMRVQIARTAKVAASLETVHLQRTSNIKANADAQTSANGSGAFPPVLTFKPNGAFKIVQFTDLHFGEDEGKDNQTLQVHARGRCFHLCVTVAKVGAKYARILQGQLGERPCE